MILSVPCKCRIAPLRCMQLHVWAAMGIFDNNFWTNLVDILQKIDVILWGRYKQLQCNAKKKMRSNKRTQLYANLKQNLSRDSYKLFTVNRIPEGQIIFFLICYHNHFFQFISLLTEYLTRHCCVHVSIQPMLRPVGLRIIDGLGLILS